MKDEREILEDPKIQLVVSAAIANERAPLGVRVMRHGKDYMADKPGITTLEQLEEVRRVQAETKRIYSICYSERLENRATVKAGELVKAGAIGRVVQTVGLGPHRINVPTRPAWFFVRERYGGILCDIASHQFDQFLFFTGSTKAEVVASQVANVNHPQHPGLEDFGDALVRGDGGSGYIRVDWFTPGGLETWGDGRLTILGTDGFIEIRKNIDLAGREGGNHLFLVDQKETRHVDCTDVAAALRRRGSWTTSSTGRRPPCRRRTASWPWSWPSGRRRTPRRCGSAPSDHAAQPRPQEHAEDDERPEAALDDVVLGQQLTPAEPRSEAEAELERQGGRQPPHAHPQELDATWPANTHARRASSPGERRGHRSGSPPAGQGPRPVAAEARGP